MTRRCILSLLAAGLLAAAAPPAGARIERRGSRLYFCGEPVRLAGYGAYGVLTESAVSYRRYIDTLAGTYGVNLVRIWANYHWTHDLTPYAGTWKRWDLTRPNAAFFSRLRAFVTYARARGVVVLLTLFDSVCLEGSASRGNRWANCPFRRANNTQPYLDRPEQFDDVPPDRTPPIWEQSHLPFLKRVVAALDGLDNVIYEVMNEPYGRLGDRTFLRKVVATLHRLLNAPGRSGSRLIASNEEGYSLAADPRVDVVTYHVKGPARAGSYGRLGKPVIVSNDGDISQSSRTLAGAARIARVRAYARAAFGDGSPLGHTHLEILDKDIYGASWLTQNYNPRVRNVTPALAALVGSRASPAPHPCGGTGCSRGPDFTVTPALLLVPALLAGRRRRRV